jgi:hypothetical protein
MDDAHTSSSAEHAARSAEALRELRERTRAVRAAQRDQMSQLERQLVDQLESLAAALSEQQSEEATAEAVRLREELDKSQAALAEADRRLEFAQQQTDDAIENESLQQKFELALQDVRRLRGRVAELEQELARRPESEQADSAELVHLRAERDALAGRVEELEQDTNRRPDANAEQEVADLQRRFELAVEDVRELKKKNAQLESQLTQAAKKVVIVTDGDAMDWESQKRRLLASLESEGQSDAPSRRKEQATIEGTIRITDEVVANKDEEIAVLREQLASLRAASGKVGVDREREMAITRLIDEDEVIQQHRKRAAQLEQEMEETLRATEMELSLERAKLARHQAELADARLELEAMRTSCPPSGGQAPTGTPKRRWLAKLGLSGDDDEK